MEPVIPCQDGQKELLDIMLTIDGKIFYAENPDQGKEVEVNISRAFLTTYQTSTSSRGIPILH